MVPAPVSGTAAGGRGWHSCGAGATAGIGFGALDGGEGGQSDLHDRQATSDLWWKNAVIYCADVATWLDSDGAGPATSRG